MEGAGTLRSGPGIERLEMKLNMQRIAYAMLILSVFVGGNVFAANSSNTVEVEHGVVIVATGGQEYRGSDYGDLLGSKSVIRNIEYRFPLLPFLPPFADFLSGFAFIDAAAAWRFEIPDFSKKTF